MIKLNVTVFPDVYASTLENKQLSWDDICNLIIEPQEYASKSAMPLIKLGTFGDVRTAGNSLRHNDNLLTVSGVEGDYDEGSVTMEEAAERARAADLRCIFYPSSSNTKDSPRWRVLAMFDQEQTVDKRSYYTGVLNTVLGGCLAPESFNLSLSYYFGKIKGSEYEPIIVDGDPLEWLDDNKYPPTVYAVNPQRTSSDDILDSIYPQADITEERARELVNLLDPDPLYGDWFGYGCAIHHQFNGSETGKQIWLEYCARQEGYGSGAPGKGSIQESTKKWEDISRSQYTGRPKTFATIIDAAKKNPAYFTEVKPVDKPNPWRSRIAPIATKQRAPNWLINGILADKMTMIAGSPGVGKTSCLVPLALTIAGFQSLDSDVESKYNRKVIYVTEDKWQIDSIIHGIIKHMKLIDGRKITYEMVAERFIVVETMKSKIPELIQLAQIGLEYAETMTATSGKVEMQPLIVFDTSSATFQIDDENSNSEASKYVAAIKENFINKGIPVWVVAHTAKANKRAEVASLSVRGAGAFEGDANCVAYLVTEDGVKDRFFVLGKHRYTALYREIAISSVVHQESIVNDYGDLETFYYRYSTLRQCSEVERISAKEEAKLDKELSKIHEYKQRVYDAILLCDSPTITNVAKKAKGKYENNRSLIDVMLVDGDLVQYDSGKTHKGESILWIKKGT